MFVPMMDVGIVGMGVGQCLVLVRMAVRLSWRVVGGMFVLMVFIMDVAVFMLHRLVFVFVPLRQVQPDADAHERRRHAVENGVSFLKDHQGKYGTNEGGEREICASPSGPQMPQGQHEKRQADSVPEQTHGTSSEHGRDAWKVRADEKGKGQVHATRNQSFCCGNLDGIPARDFPGEVVVDSPSEAGTGDA